MSIVKYYFVAFLLKSVEVLFLVLGANTCSVFSILPDGEYLAGERVTLPLLTLRRREGISSSTASVSGSSCFTGCSFCGEEEERDKEEEAAFRFVSTAC